MLWMTGQNRQKKNSFFKQPAVHVHKHTNISITSDSTVTLGPLQLAHQEKVGVEVVVLYLQC